MTKLYKTFQNCLFLTFKICSLHVRAQSLLFSSSKEYLIYSMETYVVFIGDVTNMTTFPL